MNTETDFSDSFNDGANDNDAKDKKHSHKKPKKDKPEEKAPSKPAPQLQQVANNLFMRREIVLNDGVNKDSMTSVIMQMRALAEHSKDPITLHINSPGGSVYDGMALFDTMRDIMNDGIIIKTQAYSMAASMGSFLLSAGSPGHRTMLPSSVEMTHQPSRIMGRNNVDAAEVASKKMKQLRRRMEAHYANFMDLDYTPKAQKLIKNYMGPDVYLNAYTAKRLGLVDNITLQTNDNKPDSSISQEFLRKSVETDMMLDRLEFEEIDSSKGSIDPMRYVKKLINYRDKELAKRAEGIQLDESLKLDP